MIDVRTLAQSSRGSKRIRKQNGLDFDGLPGHPRLHIPPRDTDHRMRSISARPPLALLLALPLLAGCLERGRSPIAESMGDDDQYCQAGGKVAIGTPEYVACRKDRDVQRQNAEARTDRRQRDLGEYMMNNPDRH